MTAIQIKNAGVISSVGLLPGPVAAALRAGLARLASGEFEDDKGAAVTQSRVPTEAWTWMAARMGEGEPPQTRSERVYTLAVSVLMDALADLDGPAPLILGLGEDLPGHPPLGASNILARIQQKFSRQLDIGHNMVIGGGRAAVLYALEKARLLLQDGKIADVVVVVADSLVTDDILSAYLKDNRLLSAALFDGFHPGEGAVAFIVRRAAAAAPQVVGLSVAEDRGHRYSGEPNLGQALSQVIRSAAQQAQVAQVGTVYAGLTGEGFGVKEWGFCLVRNKDLFAENSVLYHPADCIGDAGAALGGLMLMSAQEALSRGWIENSALVWASSDFGKTGAAILKKEL